MSRTRSLALAMYVGAALAGAAVALAADKMSEHNAPPADARSGRIRFYDQLKLTPAQRDSANTIMDERDRRFREIGDRYKAVLEPFRASQDTVITEYRARLSQLLTPGQKAIYDQMQQAQRNREKAPRGGEKKQ